MEIMAPCCETCDTCDVLECVDVGNYLHCEKVGEEPCNCRTVCDYTICG